MSFVKNLTWKQVLRVAAGLLAFSTFYYLLLQFITAPDVRDFAKEHKIVGFFLIVCYITLSQIFAPIAGSPGTLLAVGLYGIWTTVFLLYIASMISANINFWISRKYGRAIVEKIVGSRHMHEIDNFVEASEVKLLILSRLFGFSLFDIISYAFGLTTIHYKVYMIVTLIVGIIPGLAAAILFQDLDFTSTRNIIVWFISICSTGAVFAYIVRRMAKKKKL